LAILSLHWRLLRLIFDLKGGERVHQFQVGPVLSERFRE
jgi:hypothetical protein